MANSLQQSRFLWQPAGSGPAATGRPTVGKKRLVRLMPQAGLQSRRSRLYRTLQCAFYAGVQCRPESAATQRHDQVRVGNVTYMKVGGQWRYMAAVMDKHSHRIVGWSLGARRNAALTIQALRRSAASRHVNPGAAFHSDRGIEGGFNRSLQHL